MVVVRPSFVVSLLLSWFVHYTEAVLPAVAAAHAAGVAAAALHSALPGHAIAVLPALGLGLGAHTAAAHVFAVNAAAAHAVAVNLGAAAATGATGAALVAPDAITAAMRGSKRPQLKAIGRILQVEIARMKAAAFGGGKPAVVVQRVHSTAISRGPIITWALNLWFCSELGPEERRRQKRRQLPPWQRAVVEAYTSTTREKIPTILESLRVLQRELASQVRFGLRTSPIRVVRLLYSSLLVTLCALVAQCPGFTAVNAGVVKRWPRLVDHLAATLEKNLAETESVVMGSDGTIMMRAAATPQEALEDMKNQFEDITGLECAFA